MGIWRILLLSMLGEYGLVGRALADKIDREGVSFDENATFEPEAPRQTAVSTTSLALVPAIVLID